MYRQDFLVLLIRCITLPVFVSLSVCLHLSLSYFLTHAHFTVFQTVLLTIMGSLYEVVVHMKHSGWASYLQIRRTTGHKPMTETTSDPLHDRAKSPSCIVNKTPSTNQDQPELCHQIWGATTHPRGKR